MKNQAALVGKVLVYVAALAGLSVCFVLMPELAREEAASNPTVHHTDWPFFVAAYILAIPYFVSLLQVHKLLGYIEHGSAFSAKSVSALKAIKWCAVTFSSLVMVATVLLVLWIRLYQPGEDTPGFGPIGFLLALPAIIIATFTAVIERLLGDAIAMKAENDKII
jgi:hypothetical protein